ncbi:MAG: hypothetical protein QW254_04630 [Desulfurococcaceae archaeon]
MKPPLLHFYGIHPSDVFGFSIGVDPIFPPRKCLLDCITCPLGKDVVFPRDFKIYVNSAQISQSLNRYIDNEVRITKRAPIYVWGFGDPLLISNIDEVVFGVRKIFSERGMEISMYLHSSGLTLTRIMGKEKLINEIDHILVPFMWCSEDPFTNGWPQEFSIGSYIEILRLFNRIYPDKVVLELPVFRSGDRFYPSLANVDEVILCIEKTSVHRVLVKPLKRPSIGHEAKDVSLKYIEQVKKALGEHGIDIINKLEDSLGSIKLNITNAYEILYNHLLRKPLRHEEISLVYGDLGILALHNLLEKAIVTRINWSGKIFFKGIY